MLSFACNFLLTFLVLATFAQQQTNIRLSRNEMRIKLPSQIQFTHQSSGDVEGEICYNVVRRVPGVCTLPNECPEAIQDFRKGIQPQICNYKGSLPIICCPRITDTQPTYQSSTQFFSNQPVSTVSTFTPEAPKRPPPTSTPTEAPTDTQNFGKPRISEQKCAEYIKLVTEETVVTTLSLSNSEDRLVEKTKCLKPSSDGFIVGGTKTEAGEFAHMAVIGWQEDGNPQIDWNCGGSLISYRFVLSAAHCTSWRGVRPKIVRLGDQNLKRSDDGGDPQDFQIAQIIKHPSYKASSKYNDIALFQLDRDVRITDRVRPACLYQSANVDSRFAIATGWGLTTDRGKSSDDLLKVSLNLIANERCDGFYQRFQALKDGIINSQLCAGDDYEEKDTCNGDSGGPLQIAKSSCTYHIIGITSFGMGCGNSYGVYTRVSHFLDWIESIVWANYS